ncbi:SPOR domain-containing protein [Acidimangrovimonas sediminis]|uniref:SPOR domain-containing protein n=1 Tax=Acidimangrovimonas sediminis TaxID=2056283 RepID=UPI000C803D69|nr:SPOR domain-containing protein [Acidimangrovimonas sediminis]
MAGIEYDHQDASRPGIQPGALQGYINIAGAVTSLALIIGVGIWGYKLVRRDAAGVPVIQALKGPMRIAPEDPGGQIARNEGLAVNAVAADQPLPPAPNRVVLAPKPITLSTNDTAPVDTKTDGVAAQVAGQGAGQTAGQVADQSASQSADATASDGADGSDAAGAADQQDAAPAKPTDPVEAALMAARAATEQVTGEGPGAADTSAPVTGGTAQAVRMSPRPALRPAQLHVAIDKVATEAPVTKMIDPATLKPGTRLVQLGAYPDTDTAKAAWTRIAEQFGALIDGHGEVIQQAQSGGRTFYRLRAAGFESDSDARAFCAALTAQNAGCIPVTLR